MSELDRVGLDPVTTRWDGGDESRITALYRRNRDLESAAQAAVDIAHDEEGYPDADNALDEIESLLVSALKRGKA